MALDDAQRAKSIQRRFQWCTEPPDLQKQDPGERDAAMSPVSGARIRLPGSDASERAQSCRPGGREQSCGYETTRTLAGRIHSKPVACEESDQDRYGRVVAM